LVIVLFRGITSRMLCDEAIIAAACEKGNSTQRCNWPTTDPDIAGALWNNNGVLSISNG